MDNKFVEFVFMQVSPLFMFLLTKSTWEGVQTHLHCCLLPFEELESGCYYSDCKVKKENMPERWEAEAAKLYEWTE